MGGYGAQYHRVIHRFSKYSNYTVRHSIKRASHAITLCFRFLTNVHITKMSGLIHVNREFDQRVELASAITTMKLACSREYGAV